MGGGDSCNTGRHKQTRGRGRTPCHEEDSRSHGDAQKTSCPSRELLGSEKRHCPSAGPAPYAPGANSQTGLSVKATHTAVRAATGIRSGDESSVAHGQPGLRLSEPGTAALFKQSRKAHGFSTQSHYLHTKFTSLLLF